MLEARAAAALLLLFVVPLLGATVRPSPAVESRLNLEKYYQALSLHNAGRVYDAESLINMELAESLVLLPVTAERDAWSIEELSALKSRAHCLYGLGQMFMRKKALESLLFAEAVLAQSVGIMNVMYGSESMNSVMAFSDLTIVVAKLSEQGAPPPPGARHDGATLLKCRVWESAGKVESARVREIMRQQAHDTTALSSSSESGRGSAALPGGDVSRTALASYVADSTTVLLESTVALRQYYSKSRRDHTLCGIAGGNTAICPSHDASYTLKRVEGLCSATELPGTVPLQFYYNSGTHDNAVAPALVGADLALLFSSAPTMVRSGVLGGAADHDAGDDAEGDDAEGDYDDDDNVEESLSLVNSAAANKTLVNGKLSSTVNSAAARGAAAARKTPDAPGHKNVRVACWVWTNRGSASSIGGLRRPLTLFNRDLAPSANASTTGAESRVKRDFFAAASYGGVTWARRNNYTRIGVVGYVLAPKLAERSPDVGAELFVGHVAGEAVPPQLESNFFAMRMLQQQEYFLARQRLVAEHGGANAGPYGGPYGGPYDGPTGGVSGGTAAVHDAAGVAMPALGDLSANVHAHARDFFAAYVVAPDVKLRRSAFVRLRAMCKGVDSAAAALAPGRGAGAVAVRDAKDICEYALQICAQLRRRRIDAQHEARAAGAVASTAQGNMAAAAVLRREVARLERAVSNASAGASQRARARTRLDIAHSALEQGLVAFADDFGAAPFGGEDKMPISVLIAAAVALVATAFAVRTDPVRKALGLKGSKKSRTRNDSNSSAQHASKSAGGAGGSGSGRKQHGRYGKGHARQKAKKTVSREQQKEAKERERRRQKEQALKRERKMALERQRAQAALLAEHRAPSPHTAPVQALASQSASASAQVARTAAVAKQSAGDANAATQGGSPVDEWNQVKKGGAVRKRRGPKQSTPPAVAVAPPPLSKQKKERRATALSAKSAESTAVSPAQSKRRARGAAAKAAAAKGAGATPSAAAKAKGGGAVEGQGTAAAAAAAAAIAAAAAASESQLPLPNLPPGLCTPPFGPLSAGARNGAKTDPRATKSTSGLAGRRLTVRKPGAGGAALAPSPSGMVKSHSWSSFSLLQSSSAPKAPPRNSPPSSNAGSLWAFGSSISPQLDADGGNAIKEMPGLLRPGVGERREYVDGTATDCDYSLDSLSAAELRDALEKSVAALRAANACVDELHHNIVKNILGPEEGFRLFEEVANEPASFLSDSRPFVHRLAVAFITKARAFARRAELLRRVEAVETQTPYVYPSSTSQRKIRVKFKAECAALGDGETLVIISSLFGNWDPSRAQSMLRVESTSPTSLGSLHALVIEVPAFLAKFEFKFGVCTSASAPLKSGSGASGAASSSLFVEVGSARGINIRRSLKSMSAAGQSLDSSPILALDTARFDRRTSFKTLGRGLSGGGSAALDLHAARHGESAFSPHAPVFAPPAFSPSFLLSGATPTSSVSASPTLVALELDGAGGSPHLSSRAPTFAPTMHPLDLKLAVDTSRAGGGGSAGAAAATAALDDEEDAGTMPETLLANFLNACDLEETPPPSPSARAHSY